MFLTFSILLYVSVSIFTALFVYYAYSVCKLEEKYKHIPGPKPQGLVGFLFGCSTYVKKYVQKGIPVIEYLTEQTQKYGYTVKLRFFNRVVLFSIDPEIVKEVLIDQNANKDKRAYKILGFPTGERFSGTGLVTDIDNERWKHRRALFNPGFHRQALISFINEFNSKADILMDYFRTIANGKTEISLLQEFNRTTLDVIASVAFSMNIDSINNPSNNFNQYIYKSLTSYKYLFTDPLFMYKPQNWPYILEVRRVIRYLRKVGRDQILNRLEAVKNDETLPNDILTKILATHKDETFDIEAMIDDFITFFVAGQETTAGALAFAFLELGRHPNLLEKLRQEIDSVVGAKSYLTMDDLSELKYTSCVFKEALRLYPPAAAVTRRTEKDINKNNIFIPANTVINLSTYASARCEKFFPDPYKFKPERFDKDSNLSNIKNYTYLYYPFSLGPRNCIGQNFAQIEAKILIAKFLQNFDFKLNPTQSYAIADALTLRPKDGVKCTLTLRIT